MPIPGRRQGQRRGAVSRNYNVAGYLTMTSATPPNLESGDTFQLAALVETPEQPPDNLRVTLTDRTVTWVSSDTNVVTVNSSGLVSYVGAGSATVTATCEGLTATQAFTCTAGAITVDSVTVNPASFSGYVGATWPVNANPRDASGNFLTGRTVTWASSNPAVATVSADSGNDDHRSFAELVATGSVTITATCEGVDGTSALTVNEVVVGTNTYMGAQLPISDLGVPIERVGDDFVGTVWDESEGDIGGTLYEAARTNGYVTTVSSAAELTAAVNAVASLDQDRIIVMDNGMTATYTGNPGLTFPSKQYPSRWTWVVSAAMHAGTFPRNATTRVRTTDTASMARIECNAYSGYLIRIGTGTAGRVVFGGIDIAASSALTSTSNAVFCLVDLRNPNLSGAAPTAEEALAHVPREIILDRCMVRGGTGNTALVQYGIYWNARQVCVKNSKIMDCKKPGAESKAILGTSAARYGKVVNTTVSGGAINVLFGGGSPNFPDTGVFDPMDLEFRQVHFFKPQTWNHWNTGTYAGTKYAVKNLFELKNMQRCLSVGCVYEGNWADAQAGECIVTKLANSGGGNALGTKVEDIVYADFWITNSSGGPNCATTYVNTSGQVIAPDPVLRPNKVRRVVFDNGELTKMGQLSDGTNGGTSYTWKDGSYLGEIVRNRTASDGTYGLMITGDSTSPKRSGMQYTNNVAFRGTYGIKRSNGGTSGTPSLDDCWEAGYDFEGNVIWRDSGAAHPTPAGNVDTNNPANCDFVDRNAFDYEMGVSSLYLTSGVGGTLPGPDYTALDAQIANTRDVEV